RVLVVREVDGGLTGKVLVPTLAGVPVRVEREGDRVRLAISMARGMETKLEGTLTADRLSVAPPGSTNPPTMLRRPTADELAVLERLTPKKLPLPPLKTLPCNGLARMPPMGFSTWNHFQTKIDDRTIRAIADALVASGMRDAGYVHVNIDDGWQGTRDEQGTLRPNERFPDMKALADYLHGRGLKLGIYTSPGPKSCAGFEASYGHEEQDARTFAAWGVDYLKYDWCSAGLIYDDAEMPAVYQKMAEALRATGRPIVYSLCQYGRADVWKWGAAAGGNLWRTTGDIADSWQIMAGIGFAQDDLAPFAGPGHWNDPDMLEVGNGRMTPAEYRTHMSLWALLAAPLIAGHDVRSAAPDTVAMLTNREVIAIDQDPLGRPGRRVVQRGSLEVWSRPLSGERSAVGFFNRGTAPARIEATFSELGLTQRPVARDVWAERSLDVLESSIAADVEPHGVALLLLEPKKTAH
ncbi:MAG: glycoside hydrolase family 27 protein, partial [Candidatus Binatia bacterium]